MSLMKCGHAANARTADGIPVCAICYDITPGAEQVDNDPDLTGRTARCFYLDCQSVRPSSLDLPFFNHHPDKPQDEFYCGCYGWD